jgi:hypothetical protein
MLILNGCGQVQDWLYTRDAAKATAAQALALASSHQIMRAAQPSITQVATGALRSGSSNAIALDTTSSSRKSKPIRYTPSRDHSESHLSSKKRLHSAASAPSARARSSSPRPLASSIDAAITSMVAGGASGTTAEQRLVKRSGARVLSAAAASAGTAVDGRRRLKVPEQQLFSVIL